MKIAYCLHSTFNSGGMERIVTDKINYLSNLGYEILLITTNQQNKLPFFHIEPVVKTIDLAINYHELQGLNIIKKSLLLKKKQMIHKKKLTKVLEIERPDVVVSTFGNEVNFLYKINDGSKKVAEIHFSRNYRMFLNQGKIRKFINRYITYKYGLQAKKYDALVCLTKEDKNNWSTLKNVYVIPNFIPNRSIAPAPLNSKIAIAVGRFNYQKGFDRLINTWSEVIKYHPDWELHIYGGGELYDVINNQIKDLKLENNIKIFSPTNNIYNKLLKASLYLMSSRYEGLPMVLLEAMGCGLPIVSFDCPCGPSDLLENDNGILVKNSDEFSREIINIISDKERRRILGNNAYVESQKYLPTHIIPQWVSLFESITSK